MTPFGGPGRLAVAVVSVAVLAAACGSGGEDGPSSSGGVSETGGASVVAVEPSYLVVDDDPSSPISYTVGVDSNATGLETVVVLGPKMSTGSAPETVLLFAEGVADPLALTFHDDGRLATAVAPDGALLEVLSYSANDATVVFTDPQGDTKTVTVELPDGYPVEVEASGAEVGTTDEEPYFDLAASSTPLTRVVATATAPVVVDVSMAPDLTQSDVALWAGPGGCQLPLAPLNLSATDEEYVSCQASFSSSEVRVRTTVDVAALFGSELPEQLYETRADCQSGNTGLTLAAALFGAATIVIAAAALVGSLFVASFGTAAFLLGGATVELGTGGAVMAAAAMALVDCEDQFVTDEGLTEAVVTQLAGVAATVDVNVVPMVDSDRFLTVVSPPSLTFDPFVSATDLELELPQITVVVADIAPTSTTSSTTTSTSTTTTTTLADPFPWTFTGSGDVTRSLEGGTGSCMGAVVKIDVTLLADGSVSGTMSFENVAMSFSGFSMVCHGTTMTDVALFGNHEPGNVTVLLGSPDGGALSGPLTSEVMEVSARFSNPGQGALEGKSHVAQWSAELRRVR